MGLGAKNNLERLTLTQCKFTFKGAQALFTVMGRNYRLRELTVDRNPLDGKRLRVLREMLINNGSLQHLSMNGCRLGEDGAYYLANGLLKNKGLKTLLLAGNAFGDEGLQNFTEVVSLFQF